MKSEFSPTLPSSPFNPELDHQAKRPNKAPEPTPGSVTPRATEGVFEVKPQKVNRDAARGAPAPGVAHL